MLKVLKRAQDAAQKLVVRSALNPFLWLCGISCPMLFGAAILFAQSDVLRPFCAPLVYVGLWLPIVASFVGTGFAIFSPGKLQSEEYQLKEQALLMFQQMGTAPQLIDPKNIIAIANPALEAIGPGGEPE